MPVTHHEAPYNPFVYTTAQATAPNYPLLRMEIIEAGLPKPQGLRHRNGNVEVTYDGDILDAGQQTTLDTTITNHDPTGRRLDEAPLMVAIDRQCRRNLAALTFSHGGNTFSLSANAQRKWLLLQQSAAALTYPVKVRTVDDRIEVSLADAQAVQDHVDALTLALVAEIDACNVAKANVIAAADLPAAKTAARAYAIHQKIGA
jgi:hypothetical protein